MANTQPLADGSFWSEQMAHIFDASLDAVIAMDEQGRIVGWNAQAEKDFGWAAAEVHGKLLAETIIPHTYRAAHTAGLQRYLETGEARVLDQRLELVAQCKNGELLPVELSISEVANGNRRYFLGYIRDITQRKTHEEALLRETVEAKVLEQATHMAATAGSYEESLLRCLATICHQTAWPVGHVFVPDASERFLVSSDIWYINDADKFAGIQDAIRDAKFRRGEGLPGRIWESGDPSWIDDIFSETNFGRADTLGKLAVRSAFGFPIIYDSHVVAVLEFFSDQVVQRDEQLLRLVRITGRRMGELITIKRADDEREKLAAIVDSSFDAIIGKDLDGTILSWNAGAERTYGYTPDEVIGQSITMLLPIDTLVEEAEILLAMQTGERLEQFETERQHKDGQLIPVSLTLSPIANDDGNIIGSSTIERDISERRRSDEDLKRARDVAEMAQRQAEQALNVRGEFLANVSHELRTPMNAILGMLQLTLREELSAVMRDYLETAKDSADSLLDLLNDILDFSRMESGKFTIDNEPFRLREMLDDAMKSVSAAAFNKGLELVCDVGPDTPNHLVGDESRLRQILINLVSNSVKFTEQGEVVVSIAAVRRWPHEVRLKFSVRDTGCGIAPEDQKRIFDAFAQADASSTRNHGGVGLGLAICSELLRRMGSRLRVESALGEGSTFYFSVSLPRDHKESSIVDGVPLRKLRDLPVLVVDDNETNRRILRETLTAWQMHPTMASDGQQALALMRQAAEAGNRFPLVIVDALMPGMDGVMLTQQIHDDEELQTPPVVMMLSSADRQTILPRGQKAHVAALLSKPVSPSDLLDAISRCLNVSPSGDMPATTPADAPRVRALRILVAEDMPANQKVVGSILKSRGHHVTLADNGREAVNLATRQRFDVVLMDVQMPIMDGYQATAAIRASGAEVAQSLPIIAMTAHAMQGDRERCLEAGMDSYVSKPLDMDELLALIESISTQKDDPLDVDTSIFDGSDEDIIDVDSALKRLRGDRDLLHELGQMFTEDSPKLLTKMQTAIDNSDARELQRAAHSLKGLAANFNAQATVAAAQKLEDIGAEGKLNGAADALRELEKCVDQLHAALADARPS